MFASRALLPLLISDAWVGVTVVQVQNVACTYEAALRQGVEELQAEAGKLRAELEDTLAKFDVVQQQAEEVEAEVVDEVSGSGADPGHTEPWLFHTRYPYSLILLRGWERLGQLLRG